MRAAVHCQLGTQRAEHEALAPLLTGLPALRLMRDELRYDRGEQAAIVAAALLQVNADQRAAFDAIMSAVDAAPGRQVSSGQRRARVASSDPQHRTAPPHPRRRVRSFWMDPAAREKPLCTTCFWQPCARAATWRWRAPLLGSPR